MFRQSSRTSLVKTFRETGLPWTMRVVSADPAALDDVAAGRRNLLLAGFAFMVLVVTAASTFVYRALSRELVVARLQSDFVAAVSHEFRTPLTAMRHLTAMLEDGGAPPDRLPRYYRALAKETRRLHGMVESLLDFGRMEAGQRTYQMEDISAADLARQVVDEFCEQVSGAAHRVALDAPLDEQGDQGRADGPRIWADREALALALRNLLDNAVKYSPQSSTVCSGGGIPRRVRECVSHRPRPRHPEGRAAHRVPQVRPRDDRGDPARERHGHWIWPWPTASCAHTAGASS